MATVADASLPSTNPMPGDPALVRAVISAVDGALAMCNKRVRCVGVTAIPTRDPGLVTGLVGVHGNVSGFVTVNMSEHNAIAIVGELLQDKCDALTRQILDGVGEIANMVVGGIKSGLLNTPWAFRYVTVPSVILGRNYQITYTKGIEFVAVTFEEESAESIHLEDRLIQVSVSLMRL